MSMSCILHFYELMQDNATILSICMKYIRTCYLSLYGAFIDSCNFIL